jgi:hypothetical protein
VTEVVSDCRTEIANDVVIAHEFRVSALEAGCKFIPIVLTCEVDAHIKRVGSEERTQSVSAKLVDAAAVEELRREWGEKMYRFGVIEESVLDETSLSPKEAVRVIVE